ncbi:MAG TPA: flagellar assembly protein FliW [Solirubrobacteraceae bacterium]|nr:flagellar assembly protein FliW [Solirubrobacteraceae bacterium]
MSLTFDSSRFGPLEVDDDTVIEFPAGLIGLGGARYALIATDADAPFAWLHSVDDPDVAIPVTNPWLHHGDYSVELSDADSERVGSEDPAEVDVWVTVRAAAELSDFSCNLRAPIVVWKGRGHQVINEAPDAPVQAPLFPAAGAAQAA